jgi:hypothetical protein
MNGMALARVVAGVTASEFTPTSPSHIGAWSAALVRAIADFQAGPTN